MAKIKTATELAAAVRLSGRNRNIVRTNLPSSVGGIQSIADAMELIEYRYERQHKENLEYDPTAQPIQADFQLARTPSGRTASIRAAIEKAAETARFR